MMSVEKFFAGSFATYAAANDVIMIMPSAKKGWDNTAKDTKQYGKDGRINKFIRALVT